MVNKGPTMIFFQLWENLLSDFVCFPLPEVSVSMIMLDLPSLCGVYVVVG